MTVSNSNTFNLPSSSDKLSTARNMWNKSLQALLTNFQGLSAPNEENITIHGIPTSPNNGILFRSSFTNALYVYDSIRHKGNPVHPGGWTRSGIWSRTENSLVTVNIASYEIGELFTTPGVNTRLYMKTSNTTQITDPGIPPIGSITGTMLVDGAVTSIKLADATVNTFAIATNTITASKIANYSISFTKFGYNTPNSVVQYNAAGVAKAVVTSTPGSITKEYFSGNLAPKGTAYILEHMLGAIPKIIQGQFLCLNAELGYVSGEFVLMRTHHDSTGYGGASLVSNATHIYIKFPTTTGTTMLLNYISKSPVYISPSDWFLQVRAYA